MNQQQVVTELAFTGERLVTEHRSDTTLEHLHRYALAIQLAAGKDVLDIASGEGYGSNLLASVAKSVIGVDIASEAVLHAQRKYQRPNLAFKQGSADSIPVESASIDQVVSFETIEHHDRHEEMLAEIKRVLRADGILVMSSPDKRYYSDVPQYKNPYHVKELYLEEFRSLVRAHFLNVKLLLQKVTYGSLVVPETESRGFTVYAGDYGQINSHPGVPEAEYVICVASDRPLPETFPSLFDGSQVLRETIEHDRQQMERLRASWSFRLGRALTWPVRVILRRR